MFSPVAHGAQSDPPIPGPQVCRGRRSGDPRSAPSEGMVAVENDRPGGRSVYLRCRILARMRRFLRPSLRRPFPVFLTPTHCSVLSCWTCLGEAQSVDLTPCRLWAVRYYSKIGPDQASTPHELAGGPQSWGLARLSARPQVFLLDSRPKAWRAGPLGPYELLVIPAGATLYCQRPRMPHASPTFLRFRSFRAVRNVKRLSRRARHVFRVREAALSRLIVRLESVGKGAEQW